MGPLRFYQKLHILPWMAGSRAMHMYRTYGSRVTHGAVTEEQLPSGLGYIVYFANMPIIFNIIIMLNKIISVPMKYPG
jgi:hypothetical protein